MFIIDNVYFLLMCCQWDAGEGSLCRDENNKDVYLFSVQMSAFSLLFVCLCVCVYVYVCVFRWNSSVQP